MSAPVERDPWAEWSLHGRYGGDDRERERIHRNNARVRDRVLAAAALRPGETVLDLGCGTGLLGLQALHEIADIRVTFLDISAELLSHARAAAERMGVEKRSLFVHAPAERLRESVHSVLDVVLVRAVLIHVRDKASLFRQIYGVLRDRGRLSLFEPVNGPFYPEPQDRFWGYDVRAIVPIAAKVKSIYHSVMPPGEDPMVDFDEHELGRMAEAAGFRRIQIRVESKIERRTRPRLWESFTATAWNPRTPPLAAAMNEALSAVEREIFTCHLRPLVEQGEGMTRSRVMYMRATK